MKMKALGRIPIHISEEVADAMASNQPVVALESNVITHGLQHPHNVDAAVRVERAVRAGGAVPATVCIDRGQIRIGMHLDDIELFAITQGIPKVSSRDLPVVLA